MILVVKILENVNFKWKRNIFFILYIKKDKGN